MKTTGAILLALSLSWATGCKLTAEPSPAEVRVTLFGELDQSLKAWDAAQRTGDTFAAGAAEERVLHLIRGRQAMLVEALEGANPDERAIAAAAVAFTGDTAYLPQLGQLLDDPDDRVVANALMALAVMRYPLIDTRRVARLLDSKDPTIRAGAAAYLGQSEARTSDEMAIVPLVRSLRDAEPDVRVAAAQALGRIGDPSAVEPLMAALGDRIPEVRGAAGMALGQIGDPRALARLTDAQAKELIPPARRQLGEGLNLLRARGGARDGGVAGPAPLEPRKAGALPIGIASEAPFPGTHKGKGAGGAARSGPVVVPEGKSHLDQAVRALHEGDTEARANARLTLISEGRRGLPTILGYLGSKHVGLVVELIEILVEIDDPGAVEGLAASRHHPAELVRIAALGGIDRLVADRGRPHYARAMEDRSIKVRRNAARLLVSYRDKRGIPQMLADLDADDETARFRAIEVLRRATGKSFGYRPDASDRAAAVTRWRDWWAREGAGFEIGR